LAWSSLLALTSGLRLFQQLTLHRMQQSPPNQLNQRVRGAPNGVAVADSHATVTTLDLASKGRVLHIVLQRG
jgi:hypothetical protein